MRLFILVISTVLIFAACGDSKVKASSDDESTSDSDTEQVGDSDEETSDSENKDDPNNDENNNDETENDSDSTDAVCGNEIVESGEECDGNVKLCTEIDDTLYSGGKAKCKDDCSGFSTLTCDEVPYECGDDKVEGPEICDGGVEDCVNIDPLLYSSGKAKCNDECNGYELETFEEIFHECGNNTVEGPEVCDGNLKDCVEISSSLYSGGKALCNDECTGWDTVTCEENTGECSDTVRVVQCATDAAKDQIQSCLGGNWSNEGDCLVKDEYILLRSGDSAKSYSVTFNSAIDEIDVLTVMDTSGSLVEELSLIKTNVSDMANAIIADYPQAAFGMTTLGTLESTVYSIVRNIDENVNDYVSAVTNMTADAYGATEYHTIAIDQAISGTGTYQKIQTYEGGTVYTLDIPAASCGTGKRGGVCFRENSLPVVVVISDEAIAMDGWIWTSGSATTADDVIDSLNAINGKIGIIDAGGEAGAYMSDDADYFAVGTNSVDASGETFYKAIPNVGTGLNTEWIAMVKGIIEDTVMDVDLDLTPDASNPVNVYGLIDSYEAFSASPVNGIDGKSGSEFTGVKRDTDLTYKVVFSNNNSEMGVKLNELTLSAVWGDTVIGSKTITIVTD